MKEYKITQSMNKNIYLDKWYIKPNFALFGSDKYVLELFGCTNEQFEMVLKVFDGVRDNYRSYFKTKVMAEQAASVLSDKDKLSDMILLYKLLV